MPGDGSLKVKIVARLRSHPRETDAEAGAAVGASRHYVKTIRRGQGRAKPKHPVPKAWPADRVERVRAWTADGWTTDEMAARLGMDGRQFRRGLVAEVYDGDPAKRPAGLKTRRRLALVARINELTAEGVGREAIAAKVGCTWQHVRRVQAVGRAKRKTPYTTAAGQPTAAGWRVFEAWRKNWPKPWKLLWKAYPTTFYNALNCGMSRTEVSSLVVEAAMKALRTFDPKKAGFVTWLAGYASGVTGTAVLARRKAGGVRLQTRDGEDAAAIMATAGADDPERAEVRGAVADAVAGIPDAAEREYLTIRFGIGGGSPTTAYTAARRMGRPAAWGEAIEAAAFAKLRPLLAGFIDHHGEAE